MLKNLRKSFWFQLSTGVLPAMLFLSTIEPVYAHAAQAPGVSNGCKNVLAAHAPVKAKRGILGKAWTTLVAGLLLGLSTATVAQGQIPAPREDPYHGRAPWQFQAEFVKVRVIDPFREPKTDTKVAAQAPPTQTTFGAFDVEDVLAGHRGVQVTVQGNGKAEAEMVTELDTAGVERAMLRYQQQGISQGNLQLKWDGTRQIIVSPAGIKPPVDLTENGADRFYLDVTDTNNYGSFIVTLYDSADRTGEIYSTGRLFYYYTSAETYYMLPFSSLKPGPKGGADLTRIGAITLSVETKTASGPCPDPTPNLIKILEFGTAKVPCFPLIGAGDFLPGSLGGGYPGSLGLGSYAPPSLGSLGLPSSLASGAGSGAGASGGGSQFSSLSQNQSQNQHQHQFQQFQVRGNYCPPSSSSCNSPPEGHVVPEPASWIQGTIGLVFLAGGYWYHVARKGLKPATAGN